MIVTKLEKMTGWGISRGCVGSVYSSSAVGEGGRVEY